MCACPPDVPVLLVLPPGADARGACTGQTHVVRVGDPLYGMRFKHAVSNVYEAWDEDARKWFRQEVDSRLTGESVSLLWVEMVLDAERAVASE